MSLASYRDENCANTIRQAYLKSKDPSKLNFGLVQQNCEEEPRRSGVLVGGKMKKIPPDEDCYQIFCDSVEGQAHCNANRVRVIRIKESESLGPCAARYFASKPWYGEDWYVQIDSHVTFMQDWDLLQDVLPLFSSASRKPKNQKKNWQLQVTNAILLDTHHPDPCTSVLNHPTYPKKLII